VFVLTEPQWVQNQQATYNQGVLDRPAATMEIASTALSPQKLIGHLLKWDYQSDRRSQSWRATMRLQRDEVSDILQENPSLKPYLAEAIEKGFRKGCNLFIEETSLDFEILPRSCPYTIAQLLDPSFPTDGAED